MGHSQASKAESRERILKIAAKRFRELGLAGISISDLMKDAGLTSGGFYKHFQSREELVALAVTRAGEKLTDERDQDLLSLAEHYLSARHRDRPASGCVITALACDVSRADSGTRAAFTDEVRRAIDRLADLVGDEAGKGARAMSALASLVGAVILARAVDDPVLSDALLAATKASFAVAKE